MEECNIVATTNAIKPVGDWKTIMITIGLILLFLILSYFLYRFINHTNKRFRALEQALHNLNNRERVVRQQQPPHPPPQFFMHQEPVYISPPPPPTPQPVITDSKLLDKELTEELKELVSVVQPEQEPEGRVEEETVTKTEDETKA